jgi:hypothetical protein
VRWIWLVLLCACGDNTVPRLVALTYQVGDVTYTRPGQFHDTARDEDCAPVGWADGATYCTPAFRDAFYADSACSDAIAPITVHYTPTYFTIAGVTALRRLRPVTPGARSPGQYWVRNQDTCSGPYPSPPGAQWGEVGDELDESAFVRLLRSAPEGDGRLQTIAWHTTDGLYQPMGFHDRDLGADCRVINDFGRDRDHVLCEPNSAPVFYYADAACTQPVVTGLAGERALVKLDCESFASAGTERTGPVYSSFAGSCHADALPDGVVQYEVGAPFDVPVLARERAGAGRIQSITLVSGDVRVPDQFLHDTTLGVDCTPAPAPDTDVPRCLPTYVNIATYYRDDQCSQAVPIASENVGVCDAPVKYAADADGFHVVGAVETAPLYAPSTGDICMLQPAPGEPHDVGPAMPVDTFVPAL